MKYIKTFEQKSEDEEPHFTYDELSEESKDIALENIREGMYDGKYGASNIPEWVIDDDYLFEPSEQELLNVFGANYHEDLEDSPMIANSRENIHYISKSDQNYYLHCADALDITHEEMFLGWLNFSPHFFDYISYSFRDQGTYTKIEFEIDDPDDELTIADKEEIYKCIEIAEKHFEIYMSEILDRITDAIEYEYEDESIINIIESNDITFTEDGEPIE